MNCGGGAAKEGHQGPLVLGPHLMRPSILDRTPPLNTQSKVIGDLGLRQSTSVAQVRKVGRVNGIQELGGVYVEGLSYSRKAPGRWG